MAYVQGVPGAAGTIVNTIADWRANAASTILHLLGV